MKIAVVMGSESDREIMKKCTETLDDFGIQYDEMIMSAHRTPEKVRSFAVEAEKNGYTAIIAGAGYAAHLAGVIAAHTLLPVLAVPIDSSPLNGVDSLYASVMMPSGVPVAVFTVGKAGAKNAAVFAAEIMAAHDEVIHKKLIEMRNGWNQDK